MKQFVLMSRSGELLTGTRITFLDKGDFEPIVDVKEFRIGMFVHDGWVLTGPPQFSRVYMNNECEKWFENLGEL